MIELDANLLLFENLPIMIGKIKNVFNSNLNQRQIKATEKDLDKIKEFKKKVVDMPFTQMRERITEIRKEVSELVEKIPSENRSSLQKIDRTKGLPAEEKKIQDKLIEHMPEVYALLNEVYRRKFNSEYFDVQLRAGIILAQGQRLVEQYTGEGKTQTFQLPLVLYSLAGRGAHYVTVNDYLTRIGAEFAGHFLSELGLSVGIITPQTAYRFITDEEISTYKGEEGVRLRKEQQLNIDKMQGVNLVECSKREAYACDVTYSTNNELGFDYLRDNMAWGLNRLVQRELYFCIIDEADSILIDEARTPLIISATPSDADTEKYVKFANAVSSLEENKDFVIDHKDKRVSLTEEGIKNIENILGVDNIWKDFSMAFHLDNALRAKALYKKDDEYLVKNGEVYIVDEFTGRILKGRRYSEGLHQAIEAKEGVEVKQESKTFATITFQNLFRLYKVLCGGSGTVMTEAEEFYKIYGLESVVIPTNKPNIRKDLPDRIYKTQAAKFKAVIDDITEQHSIGRPVLIGTTSVENSEIVSKLLDQAGIPHEVLNAKFHEQEARIVAEAGRKGAVTVATNMAGRGTDIVIGGGKRGDENWKEIYDLGGLHVIGTERHDARRIDNQLRGRTGRQGEPGSTRFFVSLEDKIMRVLGGDIISRLMNIIKVPEDMPIEMKMISRQIDSAQKRIEGVNFDSRKNLVEYDDVMNQHREIFYKRRRNIMISGDNAEGKFIESAEVIDLNLPEHKDKKEKYETQIVLAKSKLEKQFNKILDEEISVFVSDLTTTYVKKHKQESLKKIFEFIPQTIVEKASGKMGTVLETYLIDLIEEKQTHDLEEIITKSVELKKSDLNEDFYRLIKLLSLETLDEKWVDHLEVMKSVREGVHLQGYAQRNPLVEYKNKAFSVFESFITNVNSEIIGKFFKVKRVEKIDRREEPEITTNDKQIEDVLTGDREMNLGNESRTVDSVIQSIQRRQGRVESTQRANDNQNNSGQMVNRLKNYGRNDKVTVKYKDGRIEKDVKFKKVEKDVLAGRAIVIEK